MCYSELGNWWQEIEKVDPLGTAIINESTDLASNSTESFAKRTNMPWLEAEASYNAKNTDEAIAKAAVGTVGGLLGGWLGQGSGLAASGEAGVGAGASGSYAAGAGASGLMGTAAGASGSSANLMQYMKMAQMMNSMNQQGQQQPMPAMPRQGGQMPELQTSQRGYEPISSGMASMPKDPRYMTEEERRKLMMQRRYY
jgi:hypothetical protein